MFIESAVRYAVSSLLIGRLGAGIHIPDFFVLIPTDTQVRTFLPPPRLRTGCLM